jgi:hypothetical protein
MTGLLALTAHHLKPKSDSRLEFFWVRVGNDRGQGSRGWSEGSPRTLQPSSCVDTIHTTPPRRHGSSWPTLRLLMRRMSRHLPRLTRRAAASVCHFLWLGGFWSDTMVACGLRVATPSQKPRSSFFRLSESRCGAGMLTARHATNGLRPVAARSKISLGPRRH